MKSWEEITGGKNEPAAVVAVRLQEAQRLMDDIKLAMIEMARKPKQDWGTVGSASHVVEQLEELASFVKG